MDGVGRIGGGDSSVEGTTVDNARTRKRDSLFLSARLTLGADPAVHHVRVRNLSAEGLMAELERAVEPGTPVSLEIRGLGTLTGSVAWYTLGRVGVRLDRPIDPTRARKPVGVGKGTPEFARPMVVPARRP